MSMLTALDGAPFTGATAELHGLTRRQLRQHLEDGLIRRVFREVYVDARRPDTVELRAQALALVLPAHAVVCDRTAAWLHGVDLRTLGEHDVPPAVDVVSTDGKRALSRHGIYGGKRDLIDSEILTIQGVRVTSPARTACDLACLRGRWRAMAVLDAFRRRCGLSVRDLEELLPRFRGRRGCRQLRELIPLAVAEADSPPESWTRLIIHDAGLPVPEPQVEVVLSSGRAARMENAYRNLRIAVEYDGEPHHSTPEDRAHDDDRRGELADDDWIILVLRKGDFNVKRREVWLAELAAAIDERAPEVRGKRIHARGPDDPSYRWRRRGP